VWWVCGCVCGGGVWGVSVCGVGVGGGVGGGGGAVKRTGKASL